MWLQHIEGVISDLDYSSVLQWFGYLLLSIILILGTTDLILSRVPIIMAIGFGCQATGRNDGVPTIGKGSGFQAIGTTIANGIELMSFSGGKGELSPRF